MKSLRKPKKLQPGDRVGIVSPSSTVQAFPRRLARGIKALEEMGLEVVLSKNCKENDQGIAGTPQQRAEDINNFFKDSSIKAIVCSTGGYNANDVLPLLDYEKIKNNPKVFCGFSDITAINVAMYAKSEIVTFNGPALLPSFGEFEGPYELTQVHFKKTLFENSPVGILPSSTVYSTESLYWDKEDTRQAQMQVSELPLSLYSGSGSGLLLGGCLESLVVTLGTEYAPNFHGVVLAIEAASNRPDVIRRNIVHLEQSGAFNQLEALLFSKPPTIDKKRIQSIKKIIQAIASKYKIPTVYGLDFGHTNPIITMPIGVQVFVDADSCKININESAVE